MRLYYGAAILERVSGPVIVHSAHGLFADENAFVGCLTQIVLKQYPDAMLKSVSCYAVESETVLAAAAHIKGGR